MPAKSDKWAEAKRRCRLNEEDIRMAKELGMQPSSLIKNIPSPNQQWKAPVKDWVRSLHEKKFGRRPSPPSPSQQSRVLELGDPAWPWPDRPGIPDLVIDMNIPFDDPRGSESLSAEEIAETESRLIRTQYLYRWGAQSVARAMNSLPEVKTVAAFGAVAQPLRREVPRFKKFRRFHVAVPHECHDLDLAVWTDDLSRLSALKSALTSGLNPLRHSPYGGIAHHQVDVHLFDAPGGTYRGRLCIFGQCPKPRKHECLVPGCGAEPFLQQFDDYRFDQARFEREPKVVLLDRAAGFLVHAPRTVDVNPPTIINWIDPFDGEEGITGDDIPF